MKKGILKTTAIGIGIIMAASLCACGSSSSSSAASSSAESEAHGESSGSSAAASSGDGTYTIGIVQLVQHDALDAATKGFEDAVKAELGDSVTFDYQNAQNDTNTCSTIVNNFVSEGVDLIMANSTPALQAAAAGTDSIPILATSVTDFATALDMTDGWDGTTHRNISGVSDVAPLDQQAAQFTELLPDAKKIGLLYCSSEANSQYQVDTIKPYLEDAGYTCEYYSFSDSNDLSSVTTTAAQESDAIYIPTDNTCASNTEIINNICLGEKTPIIAGEEGICEGCGIATLSLSFYEIGQLTGQQAVSILRDGADITSMEIQYAPHFTKEYSPERCQELGITVPDDYVALGSDSSSESESN